MCLWLLTACLGLLPSNPSPTAIVVLPTPILVPTTISSTTTTTTTTIRAPTGNITLAPLPPGNNTSVSPLPTSNPSNPTTVPSVSTNTSPPLMTSASTNTPGTTGGVISPLILCKNPDIVCISNPDETVAGSLPIDPRLGTTPATLAALQVPPIIAYNGQVPALNSAVRFPERRRKRSATVITNVIEQDYQNYNMESKHKIRKRQSCRCVPAGTCAGNNNGGPPSIDVRIVTPGGGGGQCPSGQVYCCGATISTISCGTLQAVPPVFVPPASGQANYGEYPWQALILTTQNSYVAGGVLVDPLNVLTVTHRLQPFIVSGTAPNIKVRLGEWDAGATYEPIPFQEYTVAKVFSHPSYNPNTLQYDITILRLSTPVPITPATGAATTINKACLPPNSATTYTGQRCWVSGWGKDIFGNQGQYQQILKEVDVPVVAPETCQSQLQAARLGPTFVLDTTSFICAGGEANRDSCTGDGGSGLVCQVNGQWVVVGLVAWGLGCATANVPAAYVNVAALLPWIQQQIATP